MCLLSGSESGLAFHRRGVRQSNVFWLSDGYQEINGFWSLDDPPASVLLLPTKPKQKRLSKRAVSLVKEELSLTLSICEIISIVQVFTFVKCCLCLHASIHRASKQYENNCGDGQTGDGTKYHLSRQHFNAQRRRLTASRRRNNKTDL